MIMRHNPRQFFYSEVYYKIGKASDYHNKVLGIVKMITEQTIEEMEFCRDHYPSLVGDTADTAIHYLKSALNAKSPSEFQYHANQAEFYVLRVRESLKWILP